MRPLLEGWKLVRLADVADTALGKMLDRGRPKGLPQVPYLRNVNVQWGHIDTSDIYTMELGEDERDRFAVQRGDLLVCEGGEIGRAAIWRGGSEYLAYQKAVHRIRSSSALHLPYLRYLFELYSVDGTLGRFSTGSTIAHLPQQKLRELPVPLPPLQEQSRIVEILEDHLSRLDATEGLMLKAERRLAALRRSTLKAVINRADRETVPLRRLVKRIEAGRSFGGAAAPAVKGQWGIVKVSAMTWGEFRPDENKAVPADAADPRYEIRPGDLLLSRANTNDYVGASVLVERVRPRLLLSDKSLRLVPREGVSTRWLWLALSSPPVRAQISARATGTKDSMRNVSQAALLSVEVPFVPTDEQQSDSARLAIYSEAVTTLTTSLYAAQRKQKALRRALLGAAFSGRLTGRASDMDIVGGMAGV